MPINILVMGRHADMMEKVLLLLKQLGYEQVTGMLTNEEVVAALLTKQYRVLIIGGGVDAETRQMIIALLAEKNIPTKIVAHFGNPATLDEEIKNVIS